MLAPVLKQYYLGFAVGVGHVAIFAGINDRVCYGKPFLSVTVRVRRAAPLFI